jgi:hypothetical protein
MEEANGSIEMMWKRTSKAGDADDGEEAEDDNKFDLI